MVSGKRFDSDNLGGVKGSEEVAVPFLLSSSPLSIDSFQILPNGF